MMRSSRSDNAPPATEPRALLSLWDSICLIIGIIIGASIYKTSPDIFRNVDGAWAGMGAWALGGIVSLIGALCYAELASAYRTAGGDYTYLTRAYGSKVGFFFAWAELSVIRTGGSIAFMAYIFATYAHELYPLETHSKLKYAIAGILVLTVINAVGVRPGRVMQNCLTVANIVGLSAIALIGLIWFLGPPVVPVGFAAAPGPEALPAAGTNTGGSPDVSFALCMVLVFYAYGGWNEAAFIAADVKSPRRNIRRALILGTLIVTLLYLAVNLAYLGALGYKGVCNSKAVAADMFALPFGKDGRNAISALVMLSALGSVNGLLFTGMRLYSTFGEDHKLFAGLAGKGNRHHVAYGALFAQACFSLLLIAIVELAGHCDAICKAAGWFGLQFSSAAEGEGIYELVTCTAPVFWLFFLLTGGSLFVLRYKEPYRERPFRVPLYPVLPLIFCASCAFMLYRSTAYAIEQGPAEALIVFGLMLLGVPLAALSARMAAKGNGNGDSRVGM
jgi:basic amino acid/polyamine antiporter, APA family